MLERDRRRLLAMAARIGADRTGEDPFELLLRDLAQEGYPETQLDELATEAFLSLPLVDYDDSPEALAS